MCLDTRVLSSYMVVKDNSAQVSVEGRLQVAEPPLFRKLDTKFQLKTFYISRHRHELNYELACQHILVKPP